MRSLHNIYWMLCIIVILVQIERIQMKFEFTNIKCDNLDEEFCDFEYCYLKSINRTYKYLSVKVNLHKLPITKFSVGLKLLKRFSGYKPFLYDFIIDGCKFMRDTKYNPVAEYFFGIFASYSSFNHTCPFNHPVIVDKFPIGAMDYKLTKTLPFPEGDYLFNTSWIAYGKLRAVVQIFGSLT